MLEKCHMLEMLINFQTCKQETALHLAAKRGNDNAAITLVRAGACMDVINCKSRTPLLTAIHWGKDAVAAYMVRAGASLYRVPGSKHAPLRAAVAHHNLQLVRLMLEHGAQVVDPYDDDLNWTVVHMTCETCKLHLTLDYFNIVYNLFS